MLSVLITTTQPFVNKWVEGVSGRAEEGEGGRGRGRGRRTVGSEHITVKKER